MALADCEGVPNPVKGVEAGFSAGVLGLKTPKLTPLGGCAPCDDPKPANNPVVAGCADDDVGVAPVRVVIAGGFERFPNITEAPLTAGVG